MKLGKPYRQRSVNKIRDSTGNIMLCVCSRSSFRFLLTSSSFTLESCDIITTASEIFGYTIANPSGGYKG